MWSFKCYHMLLNNFLLIDRKSFVHQSQHYSPLFLLLEDNILFSNDKAKSLSTPWKLGLINKSKYRFSCCTVTFGSYLFQLVVLRKPKLNYSNIFALSWVDKVTTGA